MWLFNGNGLTIYSPEGNVIKEHRKSQVCPFTRTSRGQETSDCSFFDIQSDGHQYVWAANHDTHRIDIFDIDTGDYAGYTPTCSTPLDLNYHPVRQEMLVRCAAADDDSPGEIDFFSTYSISANHELVDFNMTGMRAYGRIETHSSMGNHGFATQYDKNHLTKFDLSSKEILETFEIPKAYASYQLTYSPVNEHVFAAVRVCCTCGTNETDLLSCGREPGSPVLVQTGPSASDELQDGACSGTCKGSKADTIGVAEFDTVGGTFVGEHNSAAGNGCVPLSSPDGKTIVLAPFDGGKTARVLKAGKNGEASTIAADIPVDFEGGSPGSAAISDVAFIQDDTRNFIVIAGSVDNNVVIADMDDGYRMVKLTLSSNAEATAAGNRQVEWAVGSNFVWVNGGQTEEMYIIEVGNTIDSARVIRTVSDVPDGKVAFINNYERAAETAGTPSTVLGKAENKLEISDNTSAIAIAALIIGCIALVWVVALAVSRSSAAPPAKSARPAKVVADAEAPEQRSDSDTVTLGSKQVA